MSCGSCEWMALKVHPLDELLELEGTRDSAIPYLGYVEVNLQIPGIRGCNKNVLLLVILTMTYSKKVPVMMGSMVIDRLMGMIMKGDLVRVTTTWTQANFSVVMSGSLQPPHKGTRGMGVCEGGHSLHIPWPCSAQGILHGGCPGSCPYHTEGHHSSIWDHQYAWQHRLLGALHAGPHACQASMGPPAAHFCGTNCNIWRVTLRLLPGANLSEKPEYLPHYYPYQSSGW